MLDEKKLKDIALKGKGFYIRTTMDDADINLILNELEKIRMLYQSDELRYQKVNRYRWPLCAACIFFVTESIIWIILSSKRKKNAPIESF